MDDVRSVLFGDDNLPVDGFDYLPFVRPYANRWPYLAIKTYLAARGAGSFRWRIWATPALIASGGVNLLAPRSWQDSILPVVKGTICYMVGVWNGSRLTPAGSDAGKPRRNGVEVEIIDDCTKVPWFRSSEDTINLAAGQSTDQIQTSTDTAGNVLTDIDVLGFTKYLQPSPRMLEGPQLVRLSNGLSVNYPSTNGGADVQVALMCLEPYQHIREKRRVE